MQQNNSDSQTLYAVYTHTHTLYTLWIHRLLRDKCNRTKGSGLEISKQPWVVWAGCDRCLPPLFISPVQSICSPLFHSLVSHYMLFVCSGNRKAAGRPPNTYIQRQIDVYDAPWAGSANVPMSPAWWLINQGYLMGLVVHTALHLHT